MVEGGNFIVKKIPERLWFGSLGLEKKERWKTWEEH